MTDLDALIDAHVREVPDFPQAGVMFKDITPLLGDPAAFAAVVDAIAAIGREAGGVDAVVGIEARGFLLAAPVAVSLGVGVVPVRKPGKLPRETHRVDYELEYASTTLEIHRDAVAPGERVLLVDDVLATGGTAQAAARLVGECGAVVVGFAVLMEISALGGRALLGDLPVTALRSV